MASIKEEVEKVKLREEDMVKNVLYYLLSVQCNLPSKKSDILKFAMNKQGKDFQKVILKVGIDLRKIFGMRLVGMKNANGTNEHPVPCSVVEATSYIVVNKFRNHVAPLVTPNQSFPTDLVQASLFLILSCSYMQNKWLEEEEIWNFLSEMQFANHLCKRKEDFRRFLKTEYLDPLYLRVTKIDGNGPDRCFFRYDWGIRAEEEFSKYAILKFVTQSLSLSPTDFPNHLSKISVEEITKINDEDEAMMRRLKNREQDADATYYSSLQNGNSQELNESSSNLAAATTGRSILSPSLLVADDSN